MGELSDLKALQELTVQVVGILTAIGEERQERAQKQIEALVTHGLRTIFGENLSFHVIQDVKRSQADVQFVIRTETTVGQIDTPVMDARGGGMANVVGFLLRLVVLLLSPDRQRQLLVLDETFAHLSAEYAPRMAEFIRELVDRTKVQIILVTHSPDYAEHADQVYRFSTGDDGHTVVVAE